jgi:hypothetical protein
VAVELDVNTNGAAEFHRLADDVRRAGAKGIQKRLYAALNRSARPAIAAARESAASSLPSGGGKGKRKSRLVKTATVTIAGKDYVRRRRKALAGHKDPESLAERVAQARYSVKRTPPKLRQAGVRVTATSRKGKGVDLNALDRGRLRHPLFGNRRHWYGQTVPVGWFARPMEANADNVQRELRQAVREIEQDITRGRG